MSKPTSQMADSRPVLLVTNHVPPSRVGPYGLLLDQHPVELALFGGRNTHAMQGVGDLPFDAIRVSQRGLYGLASSGLFSAVVASTNGRVALPASYFGARAAKVSFVLWATIWSQPRSAAGAAGYPLVRQIYRHADSVVTYGPHVSAYVRAAGARRVFEAPQPVDNGFWSQPVQRESAQSPTQFVFAGRMDAAKGLDVLLEAWQISGCAGDGAQLTLAGPGPGPAGSDGVVFAGELSAVELRAAYASADVLVLPSIATRTFREPWGLVVNEAMNQGLAVIATDAVGAAAGGLVRDGRNGLVVKASDATALGAAMRQLHRDEAERKRLGAAGRLDVQAYTHQAWVDGMWAAITAATSD